MLSNCDYKYQKILFILMNIIFIKFSGSDFGSRGPQQGKGKNENRTIVIIINTPSLLQSRYFTTSSYLIPPFHSLTLHLFIAPLLYPFPHFTWSPLFIILSLLPSLIFSPHPPPPFPHLSSPHILYLGARYAVAVSVGSHEIRSTFKAYENGSCEWTELAEQVNCRL